MKRKFLYLLAGTFLILAGINMRWILYLGHLAAHQFKVVFYKEKISERLKRADLKPAERNALEMTLAIRRFAEERYALTDSKSYRSFYELGRKELGFNITLAPELSLKPESFLFFPIGSFDYLGFFDKALAESWAADYRKKGFDVYLAEIGGYSTLGWFEDPLYSSQLAWGETGLAQLLGHEIAHERLYFRNDTDFSELLASFIEQKLARDYLLSRNRPVVTDARRRENHRRYEEALDLIMAVRAKLEKVYSSPLARNEKLAKKKLLIQDLEEELTSRKAYFGFKKIPEINNASLAQFHRYTPKGRAFENVYGRCEKAGAERVYNCWFNELERLKKCTKAKRKLWLESDGEINAATCP